MDFYVEIKTGGSRKSKGFPGLRMSYVSTTRSETSAQKSGLYNMSRTGTTLHFDIKTPKTKREKT